MIHDKTARSDSSIESNASFIIKTYLHLIAAAFVFAAGTVGMLKMEYAPSIVSWMTNIRWLGQGSWFVPIGLFIAVSWAANEFTKRCSSTPVLYLGLILYAALISCICIPFVYIANVFAPGVLGRISFILLLGSVAINGIAVVCRKNFSFFSGMIGWILMCIGIGILAGAIYGNGAGTWFSLIVTATVGSIVLYHTETAIHRFQNGNTVAASLFLVSAVGCFFLIQKQTNDPLSTNQNA